MSSSPLELYGAPGERLPLWFRKHDWGLAVRFTATALFAPEPRLELAMRDFGGFEVGVSPPEPAQEAFGVYVETRVVALPDLYGGKIVAALDRQHPRDLFDVKLLFDAEGLTDDARADESAAASCVESRAVTRTMHGSEAPRTEPRVSEVGTTSHVVFLPDRAAPRFFLWGAGAAAAPLFARGKPERFPLIDEALAPRELAGVAVPLLEALPRLAAMTAAETERAPASLAAWSLAAKLALDLVGRERIVHPPRASSRLEHHSTTPTRLRKT